MYKESWVVPHEPAGSRGVARLSTVLNFRYVYCEYIELVELMVFLLDIGTVLFV
jgi:hypothetical protein